MRCFELTGRLTRRDEWMTDHPRILFIIVGNTIEFTFTQTDLQKEKGKCFRNRFPLLGRMTG
jgi:hypothetical protein